jgi:dynein heavy chain
MQVKFDDMWSRFETYSGGEVLFGLPLTDYPALQQFRKELALLQKLYGLYNSVMLSINGYYEINWVELDIAEILAELTEFQNR